MRNVTRILAALALASLGFAACGDSGDEEVDLGDFSGSTELYALAPQIAGASSGEYNTYLVLTDRLDGQEVSLQKSLELPGRALIAGPDGGGVLFLAGGDAPTLTRYDLVDGTLKAGPSVNFASRGVQSIGEYAGQFVFVSETKAYFFDGTTAQVIVWNPKEMTVTGALSFEEFVMPEVTLSLSAAPITVGKKVVMFPGWRTSAGIPSRAGVIVVDTETDEITTAEDDRCGYVRDGIVGPDGKIYMATEAVGAARFRLVPESAAAPCMLRYDLEAGSFDADYYWDLTELFEGAIAGSLIRGPNDEAFLRVLDESLTTIDETTTMRSLASAPAWRWARVTLEDVPKVTLLDHAPAGGSVLLTSFGGKTYIPVMGETHSSLVEMTSEGPGEAVVHVQGRLFSWVKVK